MDSFDRRVVTRPQITIDWAYRSSVIITFEYRTIEWMWTYVVRPRTAGRMLVWYFLCNFMRTTICVCSQNRVKMISPGSIQARLGSASRFSLNLLNCSFEPYQIENYFSYSALNTTAVPIFCEYEHVCVALCMHEMHALGQSVGRSSNHPKISWILSSRAFAVFVCRLFELLI